MLENFPQLKFPTTLTFPLLTTITILLISIFLISKFFLQKATKKEMGKSSFKRQDDDYDSKAQKQEKLLEEIRRRSQEIKKFCEENEDHVVKNILNRKDKLSTRKRNFRWINRKTKLSGSYSQY